MFASRSGIMKHAVKPCSFDGSGFPVSQRVESRRVVLLQQFQAD